MLPFLAPIVSMLAGKGLDLLSGAVESGADKAIELVSEKTGINLKTKTALNDDDIEKLKAFQENNISELKLMYQDKQNARNMSIQLSNAKSWLVANTGSLIALFTVLSAFALDMVMLYMVFKGLEVSPLLTLIAGANNVKAGQVLSFYFGSSKEAADEKRR